MRLFHADALSFNYAQLGIIDAIVSDPPYNINIDTNYEPMQRINNQREMTKAKCKNWERIEGENKIDYSFLFELGVKNYCLFGADYYLEYIPFEGSFSVWDKRIEDNFDKMFGSCYEMIWFYPKRKRDFIRYRYAGVYGSRNERYTKRIHPTQKPLRVMEMCLERMKLKPGSVVLDPFMGSGSTGDACMRMGLDFIGIEINKNYFEVAKKRLTPGFLG